MVAHKDGSHILDAHDFYGPKGPRVLRDYVNAHHEDLYHPRAHLGTWHDQESGKVFLDIAHNIKDPGEAAEHARQNDQIAMWDLDHQHEVPTGGTGGLEKAAALHCPLCGMEQASISATMAHLKNQVLKKTRLRAVPGEPDPNAKEAKFDWLKSEFEGDPEDWEAHDDDPEAADWSHGWPSTPHKKRTKASSSGDRSFTCAKGHNHWGAYGAAGLLIRHKGEDGQQRFLLQKRSPYVNEPDTWSVPGGAIGKHETPEAGAWREAREEMGSIPRHVKTHHTVVSTDCGNWKYHTVVADAEKHFMPAGGGETQDETAGVGWHTAKEIDDLRDQGDLHPGFARSWESVRRSRGPKTAIITPGSLPPEQQAGFDAEDDREHRRRMFDVAKNPAPGTRVWRGEVRRNDEHPETADSVGMHWSANPDSIISGWAPEGHKHVVWQGVVEDHEKQAFPRGHPIWSGRHQSFDHEAEVRFRPGAQVKLEGAYVHEPKEYPGGLATTPGYLVPRVPERTHPDWKWHPLDRHVTIRHSGQGAADYSDVGVEREAAWFGGLLAAEPAMVS